MKGWRTVLWNLANAVVATLEAAEAQYSIPDDWRVYWIIAFITGNLILRYLTNTSIGAKE